MSLMKTLANTKGAGGSQSGGGLEGVLKGLAGSAGAGGLLGGLTQALGNKPADNGSSLGDVLNSAFDQTPQEAIEPTADQEAAAGLMLRAMIQAAKSDGRLDDAERAQLVEKLGDVSAEEARFVNEQMAAPVDIDALCDATPRGMETQVYAMSLLGIDLDSRAEAEYLHKLANRYGLEAREVNAIHEQMGEPSLYT